MSGFKSLLPFLLLATLTPSAIAQDAKKDLKPLTPASQALLETWNDIGRKLIAMAEDFPEDKYDFKPTPPNALSPKACFTPPGPIITSSTRPLERNSPKATPSALTTKQRRTSWRS